MSLIYKSTPLSPDTSSSEFLSVILGHIRAGNRVLDLGAGQGIQARRFLEAGATVVAVDRTIPKAPDRNIEWKEIAIRTFFREPKPQFLKSCTSFYTLADLLPRFAGWGTVFAGQFEHKGPDLRGTIRLFYLTDLIVSNSSLFM